MSWPKYVIHVVVSGGAVIDDVYVGPFRDPERAEAKAEQIRRADDYLQPLVRELLPGRTSIRDIVEQCGI